MASGRQKKRPGRCRLRALCGWLVIFVLGLIVSGCGPIIGQFTGRGSDTVKVEAEYKLSAGNLLILIDTPVEGPATKGARPALTRELRREIESHGLSGTVIVDSELSTFRASREDFYRLGLSQIGRELSAQQVLYVKIIEFQLGTLVDNPAGQGVIRARVKVIDVEQGRRVWPERQPLGEEVLVRTPFREPVGKDYEQDFTEDLCERMAVRITKLFRDHKEPRRPAEPM